ncbi:hypothetical protein [Bernardetia sp.]|uniref:hypothetical protein n=1 Tax=Bernardetia sp. TaxID=1937974 RepID=UPI0025C5778F|nr:hypothetical protein [Bernardetia sp.]
MKFFLTTLLILVFQNVFAQTYEYDINGRSFEDSISKNSEYDMSDDIIVIRKDGIEYAFERVASNERRKPNFENTDLDSNYIYHKVAEGESTEYLLELYQICAPCFAKWNNFEFEYREFPIVGETRKLRTIPDVATEIIFEYLKGFKLYEGEYLKVALRKDYQKGFPTKPRKRYFYYTTKKQMSIYDIPRINGITNYELIELIQKNKLDDIYIIPNNIQLIIGEMEYKYACPCGDR